MPRARTVGGLGKKNKNKLTIVVMKEGPLAPPGRGGTLWRLSFGALALAPWLWRPGFGALASEFADAQLLKLYEISFPATDGGGTYRRY